MNNDKKRYNRIVLLLVGTIFLTLWVMINAKELLTGAIMYIVIAVVSIFMYLNWDRIKRL